MLKLLSDSGLPRNLLGPLLVDHIGLPRYWAAVWSAMSAAQLAESTHIKKLRCIEALYRHADNLYGESSLDAALGTFDEEALANILESWFVVIRNQSDGMAGDEKRWRTGLTFVTTVLTWLSQSHSADDRNRPITLRLHRLSTLYSQLHVRRVTATSSMRSLPSGTVETLYEMLDPESASNPFFRTQTRWRVFIAFVLMLHQGLRRGEVLLLPVDAVKNAHDTTKNRTRHWLNIQENEYVNVGDDPRYSRPGIKTSYSIRQIPVSGLTAGLVQTYAENYRGRPRHSFLLNSQAGLPLSTEALTKIFALISRSLPRTVVRELRERTGKESVTPHDLRHTCAVMRLHQLLKQGDAMDEALQKLRAFFGWSRTSSMPSRYARAVFEDRLADVWSDAFDERVSLLRSLPKGL
ncbi:site-specific integrase [Achromobacter spanius]|uniref:Integrase n=1 Tax=Achromobacter spanius TaxID=217203 RepID=A0A2S0I7Z1_9BURK|nr:site-specific integrase [Achromobacter spanius]AVJ28145.1 integrase [Achromobacter spanius]